MTTEEAEKLIDDMVKENRNVTIKGYLELRDELTAIHKSFDKKVRKSKKFTEDVLKQIDKTLAA